MTMRVDNGELYLARYAAGLPVNDDLRRVEARYRDDDGEEAEYEVLDLPWADFQEFIRLGQQLIEKCAISDGEKEDKMSGSIGGTLDQIIAEASAFSEYDVGTDDAFRLIVKLAKDAQGTADQMLERILLADRERLEIGAAQLRIENLDRRLAEALGELRLRREHQDTEAAHLLIRTLQDDLARAHQVQGHIRRERGYAEDSRRRGEERLHYVAAQLSALHDEFRTAAQRLKFVANWLTNTYAKGNNQDATAARGYAAAAKEVLDKGLDWLVERNRNRGRGVMESTAASKTAGAGSSPAARATRGAAEMLGAQPIQNDMDFCMLCTSGIMGCAYDGMDRERIWENITQLLAELARSEEAVENCNTQRVILNLMWHYRKVEE